ncbi:MAG: bifunctional phosphoribosylaminoimidazolecarboxamide formyltransferase/IMP cyclohydrolase, partial [Planctomycetes bacterium]|nr:bifunctional phosphoribosylaminoimidazolecarboxamide formyltransferase/IMP cyclohydrolase [Planctomycetota bacterium]
LGFEIVSTGGTRRHLEEQGVPVIDVCSYTGFPEIMQGRVKTLHPKVHGAILGRPDLPGDAEAIHQHGIIPFELVVCNLYPFEETIAKDGITVPEAIEQIDIGGPSMVRSAAKNHAYVAIVTRSSQYDKVLDALRSGSLDETFRRELATAAFEMTARYDRDIANYMVAISGEETHNPQNNVFGSSLTLRFEKKFDLRYGENPHQHAAFYVESNPSPASLSSAEQLHGKELSYNNLLDLDAAISIVREFDKPAAVVIKHTNPCGCGVAESQPEAFDKAYAGDPVSAFGSILGFNRPVEMATAEKLCEPNRFIEAIIAPGFDDDAFDALTTRPKWKNNVRLLRCPALNEDRSGSLEYRRVTGGLLVQDRDEQPDPADEWKTVTERPPTPEELNDLKFAWLVSKHVKSNAIVFAIDGGIVGVGAGQMSRLDSAFIAAHKAGDRSQGAVVASDAFFPFRDGIDEIAQAGIQAVIQPGGSRRDNEVITACNEHNIAMIFTGRRHFKH